ncbi:MAG: leucine-rich repeat domain-containing protein [Oscillospiraceae bacterium]|nr:leucine-rich repeat domain-containing protein [Oscillospiraceae bacterium]
MKKLVAIVLVIVMIAALGACNLFNSDSPDSTPTPTGSSDPTPTPTPEATPDPIIPNLPEIDENPVSDFEYRAIVGGVEITQYIGTSIRVRIPELIEGVPVISIGERAFADTGIMEVIIPESVTYIGDRAFSQIEALATIVIPNGVLYIGNSAFAGNIALTNVVLPIGITNMGDNVFNNTGITTLDIPGTLEKISNNAFYGMSNLVSISIEEGVQSIGRQAFVGTKIASIQIPDSVAIIMDDAFHGIESLLSVDLGNGVIEIGNGVFSECINLTNIIIPESVAHIGAGVFLNTMISSLDIPGSVSTIVDNAFKGMMSLTSVNLGYGVEEIGENAFADCKNLLNLTIPNSVIEISTTSFYGCDKLSTDIKKQIIRIQYNSTGQIYFGGYIWQALEDNGKYVLFLSKYVVENREYHLPGGTIDWENSTLRKYLNNDFYNTFSLEERALIIENNLINNNNPFFGTGGGNNTLDKIFVLCMDEYYRYIAFDTSMHLKLSRSDITGYEPWGWWLRTPGSSNQFASLVITFDNNIRGAINHNGARSDGGSVSVSYGVRPAMWLNLQP